MKRDGTGVGTAAGWRLVLGMLLLLALTPLAQARITPAQWRGEIDALVAHDRGGPPPQHGVLFVGSSSIRMWAPTLASDFPGVPVIDRGFGGSTLEDSTYYAGRIVVPYHPKLIVIYAGDNDIEDGRSPARVVADFRAFVARVRRDLPHAAIAFVSIKPSVARERLWPLMREANSGIERWASKQHDVRYVDVATPMLDAHGQPRPQLFRDDGLHMNSRGYAIWIAALTPVLARYGFHVHVDGAGRD